MSLILNASHNAMLRIMNTNINGYETIPVALTKVKGVGRRYANLAVTRAEVDRRKLAAECSQEELEKIMSIVCNPQQYKIPTFFLNRQKDKITGKNCQLTGSSVDCKLREDLERLKKIRCHKGVRHYWGLRVRGQHTKTSARRGHAVGVSKKK